MRPSRTNTTESPPKADDVTIRSDDDVVPADAPSRSRRRSWVEIPVLLVIALAIAIVIKTFLIQAFYIPSISMSPTLERGDRILVCRICTRLGDVARGDIIVFSNPHPGPPTDRGVVGAAVHWLAEGIGVAQPENKDYIKRVIGLPGDVVELHEGTLYLNGTAMDEPYLNPEVDTSPFGPVTVPDGMLFVLGDNRLHSGDSRFPPPTGLGFVGQDKVIGKAVVIVYPPSRWGWL
jgi:signal peptidase I